MCVCVCRAVLPVGALHWDLAGGAGGEHGAIPTSLLPPHTARRLPLDHR